MTLVEEIPLTNGLTAEVWDNSRPIAQDTTKVELLVQVRIELKPSYFIKPEHFEIVRKIMGQEVIFEYKNERTFVNNKEKESVFQQLKDTFHKDSLPYISKTTFPKKFALSKYWDIEKNRYKFISFLDEKPS